ncbi:MAG: MoxR family ATPase [Candidatus Accumulibacter sp.]|uniref:AAA family ATPase n=1 Tax=Accumulibacter sp. TaxID=2053492 RepID=UPI0028787ACE|nr:MoxR family ATPase [Accumulibacter sp.]MDS4014381.1 MoxR family ATPase [Accumulibacter sp.]
MSRYSPRHFQLPDDDCFPGEEASAGNPSTVAPYIFSRTALIAVDVALATERPLLVAGPPGCGKSRLAETMAAVLKWSFVRQTITSRTRCEQLTVEVDHLRRLNDAHRAARADAHVLLKRDREYYNPGIFWWAFDPRSAELRGLPEFQPPRNKARFPGLARPAAAGEPPATVVLIDEIDKAEPDLPNDLLEPLDRRSFGLPDNTTLTADPLAKLLTIITTNGERELPQAFIRRCVTLRLEEPTRDILIAIAAVRAREAEPALVAAVADKILALRDELKDSGRRPPGTSEFLDAVLTCHWLAIGVDSEVWQEVEQATLRKPMLREDERSERA